ncbi:MAG: hypothetical protein JXB32_03585, partial [Deltaproteobacteria bacterium]|nr:hypothetical protein [Deltaproteobacteria bacterium]
SQEAEMDDQRVTVSYYAEPGPQNTEATLAAARARAEALGLRDVVVATDTGKTARAALAAFGAPFRVVAVSNPPGVALPLGRLHDYLPRFREHRAGLVRQGVVKVPCSLTVEQAAELQQAGTTVLRVDWKGIQAFTKMDLRSMERIGVGVRVAVCCALTAVLAKAVPAGEDVVALAGTGFGGGGADTAVVLRTAAAWRDWRVLETLARPRESPPSEGG